LTGRKWNPTLAGAVYGGSFNPGTNGPASNRPVRKHLIAFVNYSTGRPTPEAPILCVCSWQGVSEDWEDHKKEAR
jgi:hypothetical protein